MHENGLLFHENTEPQQRAHSPSLAAEGLKNNPKNGGMIMANLQIKGIDDDLYSQIKLMASQENRSISQQILFLVKTYMAKKHFFRNAKSPAQVLLELSGSWGDSRTADQIVSDIKSARKSSKLRGL
jgi:hypothetical protein